MRAKRKELPLWTNLGIVAFVIFIWLLGLAITGGFIILLVWLIKTLVFNA